MNAFISQLLFKISFLNLATIIKLFIVLSLKLGKSLLTLPSSSALLSLSFSLILASFSLVHGSFSLVLGSFSSLLGLFSLVHISSG